VVDKLIRNNCTIEKIIFELHEIFLKFIEEYCLGHSTSTHRHTCQYQKIAIVGLLPKMLACDHGNGSILTLSIHIRRYPTTIEGAYNINTYL